MSYIPKVGEKIAHDPTGDYLGVVTSIKSSVVRFDGPRTRDGVPVTLATIYEIQPWPPNLADVKAQAAKDGLTVVTKEQT